MHDREEVKAGNHMAGLLGYTGALCVRPGRICASQTTGTGCQNRTS